MWKSENAYSCPVTEVAATPPYYYQHPSVITLSPADNERTDLLAST